MSDSESTDSGKPTMETSSKSSPMFPPELAAQFAEFLRLSISSALPKNPTEETKPHRPESLGDITVSPKLDGENYPLWANMIDRAIGGKGLTSHIDGLSNPPLRSDPSYQQWQQRDHCVFSWIINNISPDLVNEVSQYATAMDLWEGLAVTYGSGTDPFQIYDLHRQTSVIKQEGMSLEALWNKLQGLWISIDRRDPNPMEGEAASAIEKYGRIVQKQRLYQFITALDDKYDVVKKEIMRRDPLPTVRAAYGIVRRESNNNQILTKETGQPGIGTGLSAVDRGRSGQSPNVATNRPWSRRQDEDRSKLICSHCGGKKHTKEGCFLLVGYPDWWDDMKKARATKSATRNNGRAAVVVTDRVADAGKSAGNSNAEQLTDGGDRRNEETARASAVRVWDEGNIDGDSIWGKSSNPQYFAGRSPECAIIPPEPTASLDTLKTTPNPHIIRNKPIQFAISQKTPHFQPYSPNQPHLFAKIGKMTPEIPKLGFDPNIECKNQFQALALIGSVESRGKDSDWIFDCGATDTMSFDISDFIDVFAPRKKFVQTANGHLIPVQGTGTIKISPTLKISNCLYVPSLAHKLLSVSHVTKELQCELLMQPNLCVLQDLKTGSTVGHGTEQDGLYYVDKVAQHVFLSL
ncbi:uncharacterized protein LOC125194582 [Salvia hispanica]|uniref:uncharacterized protein LOC125194582 n=1 Tax=Salvia hispanica TaxID=49212 RepID=UPI002009B601|nr:uncharacterized protein LOC125194582 [Salvia hispanica]